MKKTVKTILCVFISLFVTLTVFGYGSSASATEPGIYYPVHIEIKSDKMLYEPREEITIELLFSPNVGEIASENYTYYFKLTDSPYYESIGDDVVCGDRAAEDALFKGENSHYYHYRAVFKIKVTAETPEEQPLVFYIKCAESDWIKEQFFYEGNYQYSDDPEYDMRIQTDMGFEAFEDGVAFPQRLHIQQTVTVTLPKSYYFSLTLANIFEAICDFLAELFSLIRGLF